MFHPNVRKGRTKRILQPSLIAICRRAVVWQHQDSRCNLRSARFPFDRRNIGKAAVLKQPESHAPTCSLPEAIQEVSLSAEKHELLVQSYRTLDVRGRQTWMDGRRIAAIGIQIWKHSEIVPAPDSTGHHLTLLSLQKLPEETCWRVLVENTLFVDQGV